MQNPDFNDEVRSLAVDLAWSLWAELGVSGWARRHTQTAIDAEPLILATPIIADLDARLLHESMDWCVANARLVSAVRLRNLLKRSETGVGEAFGAYAATVNQQGRFNWPGATTPSAFSTTGRSSAPDLTRPALLQLRLRGLIGVSARAEILRQMLAEPTRFHSIAELANLTAFGKDNVADALELMSRAGAAEPASEANRLYYRLSRPEGLLKWVGVLPESFPNWAAIFRMTLAFLRFASSAPPEPMARAAEIRSVLRQLQPDIPHTTLIAPFRAVTGEGLVHDFQSWLLRALRMWAGVEVSPRVDDDTIYTIHRLDFGGYAPWQGWIHAPGELPRPIEMPEWSEVGYTVAAPRSDAIIADDSAGAPRLAHAMFEHAFRRVSIDIGPYWAEDPTNQVLCQKFAAENLRQMHPGASVTFSESFLRTWHQDRKAAMSRQPAPSDTAAP